MSLIYVTTPSGETIIKELSTPYPASQVTAMLTVTAYKGCAFWTITEKPDGKLYAWVTWEGEDRPVSIDNLPNLIQMKLLTGAY